MSGGVVGARGETGSVDKDDGTEALLLSASQYPSKDERLLELVLVVAQRGGQGHALAGIDFGGRGIARKALGLDGVHLAEAEDEAGGETERVHILGAASEIVFLQCALIGVHVLVIGLDETEGDMLMRLRQQDVESAAARESIAPRWRLELGPGDFGAAAGELHEGNEPLAEEEAIHAAGLCGVEGVRDAAKLHK